MYYKDVIMPFIKQLRFMNPTIYTIGIYQLFALKTLRKIISLNLYDDFGLCTYMIYVLTSKHEDPLSKCRHLRNYINTICRYI